MVKNRMDAKAQILMATYIHNDYERGTEFLTQQLESLLAQTHENMEILIRDDGSTEDTLDILSDYKTRYPDKITIIEDDLGNLGYARNFEQLMIHSDAPYLFFSDQDDVWFPHKLKRCIEKIQETEAIHGTEHPIIVHHDARLANADGIPKVESMNLALDGLMKTATLNTVLYRTAAAGFTISANRALIKKATPIPAHASAHDFHVGVIAKTFGEMVYLDEPLADYRIHGKNVSATTKLLTRKPNASATQKISDLFNMLKDYKNTYEKAGKVISGLHNRYSYAQDFLEQFNTDPDFKEKDKALMKTFNSLKTYSPISRFKKIRDNNFMKLSSKAKVLAILIP